MYQCVIPSQVDFSDMFKSKLPNLIIHVPPEGWSADRIPPPLTLIMCSTYIPCEHRSDPLNIEQQAFPRAKLIAMNR